MVKDGDLASTGWCLIRGIAQLSANQPACDRICTDQCALGRARSVKTLLGSVRYQWGIGSRRGLRLALNAPSNAVRNARPKTLNVSSTTTAASSTDSQSIAPPSRTLNIAATSTASPTLRNGLDPSRVFAKLKYPLRAMTISPNAFMPALEEVKNVLVE